MEVSKLIAVRHIRVKRDLKPSESLRTGLGFPLPSTGLEDRPSSGSWGSSDQNSSSFDSSRVRHLCKAQVPGFPFPLGQLSHPHPPPCLSPLDLQ